MEKRRKTDLLERRRFDDLRVAEMSPAFSVYGIFQHNEIGRGSEDEVEGSRGLGPLHQQAQVASGVLCTHRCPACKYLTSAGKERFFENEGRKIKLKIQVKCSEIFLLKTNVKLSVKFLI